jgi:hypothetical protein
VAAARPPSCHVHLSCAQPPHPSSGHTGTSSNSLSQREEDRWATMTESPSWGGGAGVCHLRNHTTHALCLLLLRGRECGCSCLSAEVCRSACSPNPRQDSKGR